MSVVISCPNCGQKNRIDPKSGEGQTICAACWTRLNAPQKPIQPPPPPEGSYTPPRPQKDATKNGTSGFRWVWWSLITGGIIVGFYFQAPQDTNNSATVKSHSAAKPTLNYPKVAAPSDDVIKTPLKPIPSYPEVTMPPNGAIKTYTNSEQVAPLKIQTSHESNYFVKIVSVYSQQPVMTIFIRGGNTISTKVPLGTYEIRYASGKKWYGYEHFFGPGTNYSKADEIFTFETKKTSTWEGTTYQTTGYAITLYQVPHGNLKTIKIDPSRF